MVQVVTGLAGPQRLTPSVWISSTGLHVCGPADIYNSTAYPGASSKVVVNPIAMIRSASMLLRYALDEPAAADLVQQALERTLEVRSQTSFVYIGEEGEGGRQKA